MVDLVPVDHEPEFTGSDQAAMQPETFVPPFLSDWVKQAAPKDVDILKKTAQPIINAMMAPGQALASTTPITTEQMLAPARDMAGITTLGAGAMPAEANSLRMGIKAYHGSPHDFDAFDLSKIGTGEGAQAYGHGLYFAENEGVANAYKKNLAPASADVAPSFKGDGWQVTTRDGDNYGREFFPTKEEADAHAAKFNKGHMYQVDINADPEHFLDWDKPVSQQSVAVREALAKKAWADQAATAEDLLDVHVPGEQAYKRMVTGQGGTALPGLSRQPQALSASEQLRTAGIPGIKYLDQGSRPPRSLADTQASIKYYNDILAKEPNNQFAADQLKQYQSDLGKYDKGSRNYVVFNDKIIDILKKYGIAGLPAAGVAAGAMQSQPNPADMVNAIRGQGGG